MNVKGLCIKNERSGNYNIIFELELKVTIVIIS